MEELISIIVPVYNMEKYIKKCVKSISNQSYRNIEIILVNDGSTDSSLDVCQYLSNCDNRIMLISQENKGVSAARNLGIESAHGCYICFVDADDYVSEDYVSFLHDKMVQSGADLSVCAFAYEMKPGVWKKALFREDDCMDRTESIISLFNKSRINNTPFCKLYKVSILKEFHVRFNESIKMAEDKLFCYEYLIHCNKIYISSQITYFYTLNPHSASNRKYVPRRLDDPYLGFLAIKEIEKLVMKEDRKILSSFYSFAAKEYVRWVYRYNLFLNLPPDEVGYIRKYVKYCYRNGKKQELWNAKKSYIAGIVLIMSKTLTIVLCSIVGRFHKKRI